MSRQQRRLAATISSLQLITGLLILARNAIPVLGVVIQDWAAPAALLLYLGENILLAVLGTLFVRLRAPAEDTVNGAQKTRRDVLQTFALIAVPFTFGAALITAVVLIARSEYVIDREELLAGFAAMLVLQLAGFGVSLGRTSTITLEAGESMLVSILGRVFLLAFAVWGGLLLAMFIGPVFVVPFMMLKSLVDLTQLRPEALKRRLLRAV